MHADPDKTQTGQTTTNTTQQARTGLNQSVVADLLVLAEVLQALQLELSAFERITWTRAIPITSIDMDLLSSSIRRVEGSRTLSDTEVLTHGDMYVDLPSARNLSLRVSFHQGMPESFFVREMRSPRNGDPGFHSMRVGLTDTGEGSLAFADLAVNTMAESSDWSAAAGVVNEIKSSVALVANKLNRPDLSQKVT